MVRSLRRRRKLQRSKLDFCKIGIRAGFVDIVAAAMRTGLTPIERNIAEIMLGANRKIDGGFWAGIAFAQKGEAFEGFLGKAL